VIDLTAAVDGVEVNLRQDKWWIRWHEHLEIINKYPKNEQVQKHW